MKITTHRLILSLILAFAGIGFANAAGKAIVALESAAVQGHAGAEFNLGIDYGLGDGVPQDYAKAVYWFRKAAAQGYVLAENILGFDYDNGIGVPQNDVLSAKWFILAKASGYPAASNSLNSVESEMIPAQISEAQHKANRWWAAHHKAVR